MNERKTKQTGGVKNREKSTTGAPKDGWKDGWKEGWKKDVGAGFFFFVFLFFFVLFLKLWDGKKGESGMEKVITAELPEGSPAAKGTEVDPSKPPRGKRIEP